MGSLPEKEPPGNAVTPTQIYGVTIYRRLLWRRHSKLGEMVCPIKNCVIMYGVPPYHTHLIGGPPSYASKTNERLLSYLPCS